jgi:hypothetical protein
MMFRKTMFLSTLLLCVTGVAQAQESDLGITLDTTYASKYIWHGFDFYVGKSAIQPSVDVDLFDSGFGVNVWHSRPNASGFRNVEEFDYTLYYGNQAFEGTTYAMDYTFSYLYYDYYDTGSKNADLQELLLGLSWPELIEGGLVPSYTVGKLYEAQSGSTLDFDGWVHLFGLSYDWVLPGIMSDMPEQVVTLLADVTYNDGFNGAAVDHDWSHATIGAATPITLAPNLTFTPAVFQQISMEDTVNTDNDTWTTLSVTYQF